ncbi:MAG TPA: cysteine--tRNA ligase [Candidatus Nitrosopolaris sp.]|nr:cysteine--tRNA ligase [Candidatus Nitrosopolaris sp.]
MIRLYNTLGRKIQEFRPLEPDKVKIYTCGPTVYDYQHIGNYSGYIYWDILVRLFKEQGYAVQRVMNITDVGHLVSDADEGEDKLEKSAQREGKTARQVADFYTEDFYKGIDSLGLLKPDQYAKATDFIPQQLEIVQKLLDKGFAYQTEQAIYFDVSKLSDYGKLTGQKLSDKEVGARAEVVTDKAKHHPQDFALWFFTVERFAEHEMRWDSPWGSGFPGWHLECSAIIHAVLGEPIDIHTGGVDHIGTHHTNEIAQTEAAFDKSLADLWLHNNHMMVDGQKISKSLRNGYTIDDLAKKGFSATDFKLLVLQSHYRSQMNFKWEALEAAQANLADLHAWADQTYQLGVNALSSEQEEALIKIVKGSLAEDLNTTVALASVNGITLKGRPSRPLLRQLDELLGLGLSERQDITSEQKQVIEQREQARRAGNWPQADELRQSLKRQRLEINDTDAGPVWSRA